LLRMRAKVSAGLLMFRVRDGQLEVFLAHPGGPFFAHRDDGHWTIPKGEIEPGEEFLTTALREFKEEVGIEIDSKSKFFELGSIRQKGGKVVHAWGVENDWAGDGPVASSTYTMEWPPNSGKMRSFPEVDRAQFFAIEDARHKIKDTQIPLLDRLESLLIKGA